MLAGNLNAAVASATRERLSLMEKRLRKERLSKAEKEALLYAVRNLRKDLGLPPLPNYNTGEFSKELGQG